MRRTRLVNSIPLVLALATSPIASFAASDREVSFSNLTFGPISVSGFFDYDSVTGEMSQAQVTLDAPGYSTLLGSLIGADPFSEAILLHSGPQFAPSSWVEFILTPDEFSAPPNALGAAACTMGAQCNSSYVRITVAAPSIDLAPGIYSLICGLCQNNPAWNQSSSDAYEYASPNYRGFAISSVGQILVTALPVPEPASVLLLTVGVAAIGGMRRRPDRWNRFSR